jgi:hypothetical protein
MRWRPSPKMNRARRPRSPSASSARAFRTGCGRAAVVRMTGRRSGGLRRGRTNVAGRAGRWGTVSRRRQSHVDLKALEPGGRHQGHHEKTGRHHCNGASVANSHFWRRGSATNVGSGRFCRISGPGASDDHPSPGECMAGSRPKRAPPETAESAPSKLLSRGGLRRFR